MTAEGGRGQMSVSGDDGRASGRWLSDYEWKMAAWRVDGESVSIMVTVRGVRRSASSRNYVTLSPCCRPAMASLPYQRIECFQLGKADRHSLDFTVNRVRMKLFKTASNDVVKDCQSCFAVDLPSCVLKRRQDKFILRYISTANGFASFATSCN